MWVFTSKVRENTNTNCALCNRMCFSFVVFKFFGLYFHQPCFCLISFFIPASTLFLFISVRFINIYKESHLQRFQNAQLILSWCVPVTDAYPSARVLWKHTALCISNRLKKQAWILGRLIKILYLFFVKISDQMEN